MLTSICLYYPGNPTALLKFLESVKLYLGTRQTVDLTKKNYRVTCEEFELLLWVDNDDHKVSKEFYTIRKFINSGLNLKLFINPSLPKRASVLMELVNQASGSRVVNANGNEDIQEVLQQLDQE